MRERWRAVSHEMRLMIQRNMHMKPRLRNPRHFDRCLGQLVRSGQKPNIFAWQHLLCPSWRMFDRCYNNLANKPGRKDSNTWLRWISNSRWSHRNDGSEPTLWKIHGANKDTKLRYAIVVTWSIPDCDRTKLKFDFSDYDDSEPTLQFTNSLLHMHHDLLSGRHRHLLQLCSCQTSVQTTIDSRNLRIWKSYKLLNCGLLQFCIQKFAALDMSYVQVRRRIFENNLQYLRIIGKLSLNLYFVWIYLFGVYYPE